jgi:hypothetical protein
MLRVETAADGVALSIWRRFGKSLSGTNYFGPSRGCWAGTASRKIELEASGLPGTGVMNSICWIHHLVQNRRTQVTGPPTG